MEQFFIVFYCILGNVIKGEFFFCSTNESTFPCDYIVIILRAIEQFKQNVKKNFKRKKTLRTINEWSLKTSSFTDIKNVLSFRKSYFSFNFLTEFKKTKPKKSNNLTTNNLRENKEKKNIKLLNKNETSRTPHTEHKL